MLCILLLYIIILLFLRCLVLTANTFVIQYVLYPYTSLNRTDTLK